MSSSQLPAHMIEEILMLMPVKSLLRFRCISKSYRSMIDSPSFINKHSSTKHLHHLLMLGWPVRGDAADEDCVAKLCEASLDSRHAIHHIPLNRLRNPNMICVVNTGFIVAYCKGLLLLRVPEKEDYVLWNPFTRRYKKIPASPSVAPPSSVIIPSMSSGLGYDHIHDDYKIVKAIGYFKGGCVKYQVNLYSLQTNTWTSVQRFDADTLRGGLIHQGVYAGGYLYWLTKTHARPSLILEVNKLLVFNLCKKEFEVLLPLPQLSETSCNNVELLEVEQCLCLVSTCTSLHQDMDATVVTLYRLNHHNDTISTWNKWLVVKQGDIPYMSIDPIEPILYSDTCVKLLLRVSKTRLCLFDVQEKTCSVIEANYETSLSSLKVVCLESLIKLGEDDHDSF